MIYGKNWFKAALFFNVISSLVHFIGLYDDRPKTLFRMNIYHLFIIICIFNTMVGFSLLVWDYYLAF